MARATLVLAAATLALQGCAAAAIPVVAGGFVGQKDCHAKHQRRTRANHAAARARVVTNSIFLS